MIQTIPQSEVEIDDEVSFNIFNLKGTFAIRYIHIYIFFLLFNRIY